MQFDVNAIYIFTCETLQAVVLHSTDHNMPEVGRTEAGYKNNKIKVVI